MITRTAAQWRTTPHWQQQLAQAVRNPDELINLLQLPTSLQTAAREAASQFPLRVPHSFIQRMEKGNPADPLLRQVLPLAEENQPVAGYRTDPVGDLDAMADRGVLHKYHGRVLLTLTGACAVHCRYCFRRHFPYQDANPARDRWQAALQYLQRHEEVNEVILSGGDPLSLNDRTLSALVARLEQIPHLKRLRIHSRLPVVLPARLDAPLLNWLRETRLQSVMVIHANHANELNDEVAVALQRLKPQVDALLNQSVLLAGVNDDVQTLVDLSERLFACGVQPYYLHALDPVQNAAHFDVDEYRAAQITEGLRGRLPGYLLPKWVREIPGEPAKMPI
jgi:EF-P beta-lysylation protein EpmB